MSQGAKTRSFGAIFTHFSRQIISSNSVPTRPLSPSTTITFSFCSAARSPFGSPMASSQTQNLDSKKRSATPSSLPPTRSKSRIYISSHGFYSLRRRNLLAKTSETAKLRSIEDTPTRKRRRMRDPMQDSAVSNPSPCVLVKDLRTRRVFSPGCQLCIDGDEEKETGSAKGNQGFEDWLGNLGGKAGEKGDVLESEDLKVDSVDLVVDLNEESPQATPPDAEIFGYRDEDGGSKVECVTGKKTEKKKDEGLLDCSCRKKENNSGMKLIASPPSRVKLFKTPGSFSYKRMLPFFMDMAKDDSCNSFPVPGAQKKDNCNVGNQQISVNKCITNNSSLDYCACVSRTHSQDVPGNLSDVEPVEQLNDLSMIFCSPNDASEGVTQCCTDAVVIEENERTDAGNCFDCNSLNHSNSNLSSGLEDSSLNDCSIDGRPVDRRAIEVSVGDDKGMSLTVEKNQSGVDHKAGQRDHELKTRAGDTKESDAEDQCMAANLNDTKNLNLPSTEGNSSSRGQNKDNGEGETLNGIEHANIQETPSDAEVSAKAMAFEDVDSRIKTVSQTAGQILKKPLNGTISRNNDCISDKRMDSSSKSKLGLNPCSLLKLFKNPSSFSYRRMLPYLMDITKQDSGAFENGHSAKLEKCVKESLLSEPSTSDIHENPVEKSNGESFHAWHDTNISHTLQKAVSAATTDASNNEQQNLMSPEKNSATPSVSNGQQESQAVEVISDEGGKLEVFQDIVSITNGSSSPTMPLSSDLNLASSPGGRATLVSRETLVENGGGCILSAVELPPPVEQLVEVDIFSQSSSELHVSVPLGISVDVSRKSILKRNPRGCRGSCTCLNCSSFRLNAERAFEFSKNQMQDAEEVALNLIKELSYLRNMLEKSSFGPDDHKHSMDQLKEACRKASEAEELAKNRLREMNYDLNIHRRIPCGERPRVRFADNVGERLVPKMT